MLANTRADVTPMKPKNWGVRGVKGRVCRVRREIKPAMQ